MKNISYLLLLIMGLWGSFSCSDSSFLDETVTTDLDYERVFSDSTLTEGFLMEIYREVGFDVKGNRFSTSSDVLGGLQTASDEAEYRQFSKVSSDVQFATGTVNPVVISDDAWNKPFNNIRRVNLLFKGLNDKKCKLSDARKKSLKAEARFLRAWYYSIMLRHYGGVPVIGDSVFSENDNFDVVRQSFDSCLNYIVNEANLAISEGLSAKPTGRYYGRASAGACRALISRVKLYAASPLYNGNNDIVEGTDCPAELLGYPKYDAERWNDAKAAAYEIISSRHYKIYENHTNIHKDGKVNGQSPSEPGYGFYALFFPSDEDTGARGDGVFDELIFDDRSLNRVARESWYQPPSRSGTTKSGFAYQNLVDAFPMKDGTPINESTDYDPQNPYKNRDPRLFNTVVVDGTIMVTGNYGEKKAVDIYINADGSSGQDAVYTGTPTGYYINKGVSRYIPNNSVHGSMEQNPLIRYAEILLNYAEAHNEYAMSKGKDGEGSIVPSNEKETYHVLKQLRKRGGINNGQGDYEDENQMFGLKANMTRLEMRKAIQLERRLELAMEGHRFFDVRRWKIADETDNQQMTGMEIRMQPDGTKKYTKFNVRSRVFRKAMYFWPIPYKETIKSPNIIQNPNYNL